MQLVLAQLVGPSSPTAQHMLLLGLVQIAVAVTVNAGWVGAAAAIG